MRLSHKYDPRNVQLIILFLKHFIIILNAISFVKTV